MPLIQVTSGGQRILLKKKLQVCESQQSCLFVGDQILIFHHNLQINSLKILQCDFLDFFSYFVSHSWGIPMMKITGLSHLFKWENWWLTKYFFAPLYIYIYIYIYISAVKRLIAIDHIQNKRSCFHNICVCTVYIYYVYTVSHRSEYTPHIFVNIFLYLFMWQHWRNYTLLQCNLVSV